jgi:hypothetical protein
MDTTETIQPAVAARSPRGCSVPLMTQITPDERATLVEIAEMEMRSLSSTARMLILAGIEKYQADTAEAGRA